MTTIGTATVAPVIISQPASTEDSAMNVDLETVIRNLSSLMKRSRTEEISSSKRRAVAMSQPGRPRSFPVILQAFGEPLHFLELPVEIHEYIIQFLQEDPASVMSLMLVHSFFFDLVRDSLTRLDTAMLKLAPRIQPLLAVKFPNLLYLKLGHMPPAVIGCLLAKCRYLKELYIDFNQFAMRCPGLLFRFYSSYASGEIFPQQVRDRMNDGRQAVGECLEKLTLPGCMLGPSQVESVVDQAPNLTEFNVHGNSGLAEGALIAIANRLKQLRVLRAPSSHFTARVMSAISSDLSHLHTLDISYSACPVDSCRTLGRSPLRHVLTTLRASHVFRMSNDAVIALLDEGCTKLTSLDLSGCVDLNNPAIEAIGRNLRDLKHLNLENVGLMTLTGCSQLQTLTLGPNKNIHDGPIQALAESCKQLTKFHLDGSRVSGKGVDALTQNCTLIEDIRLSDGTMLSNAALRFLRRLKLLKKVNISACGKRVTDNGVIDLVRGRPDTIEELDLTGLQLSSVAINAVATSCRRLRCLRVHADWCTIESLRLLRENCVKLTELCVVNPLMAAAPPGPVAADGEPPIIRKPQRPKPTNQPLLSKFDMTATDAFAVYESIMAQRRFTMDVDLQREHLLQCLLDDDNECQRFEPISSN